LKEVEPIFTTHLFNGLHGKLMELLQSLSREDWNRKTVVPHWTVKDVAAHLLDGDLRTLSMLRDNHNASPPEDAGSYRGLVRYLNGLNAQWVQASSRLSPDILTALLDWSGRQYTEFIQSLNPFDMAPFPVAWAGETESENWFHIAREYTEKWHHQQQIRLAVGKDHELLTAEYYFPYLDTSVRALPYHYRNMKPSQPEMIQFTVTGKGGGIWLLYFNGDTWELVSRCFIAPVSTVRIGEQYAWRIFTKGISREEAAAHVEITGDQALGSHVLTMLAVMAVYE
jgi:uncharacterized protein (TIGR03083 family)